MYIYYISSRSVFKKPRILSLDKRVTPTLICNSPPGGFPWCLVLGLKIYPTVIPQFPVDNTALEGDHGEYSTSRTAHTHAAYYALIYTHSSQKEMIYCCLQHIHAPSLRPIYVLQSQHASYHCGRGEMLLSSCMSKTLKEVQSTTIPGPFQISDPKIIARGYYNKWFWTFLSWLVLL